MMSVSSETAAAKSATVSMMGNQGSSDAPPQCPSVRLVFFFDFQMDTKVLLADFHNTVLLFFVSTLKKGVIFVN